MKKFPMEHRIQRPNVYRSSVDTDLAATFKAERKRITAASSVQVLRPLVLDVVALAPRPLLKVAK